MKDEQNEIQHQCDESCVCPIHKDIPMFYWSAGGLHACQLKSCEYSSVSRGGLPWDHPDSTPLQGIKDQLDKDRENYGRV